MMVLLIYLWLVSLFVAPTAALVSVRHRLVGQHTFHQRSSVQMECPITATIENGLVNLYKKTYNVKCPFLRRKSFDALEVTSRMVRMSTLRNDSRPLFLEHIPRSPEAKLRNPAINEIADCIHKDWLNKGYYVTGNITSTIYKDDCVFDGPDPDMPVQGLRKFALTLAQLFVHSESHSELLRPLEIDPRNHTITAYWRISGRLNLPWKPSVKPWAGSTLYSIDPNDGLVERHVEQWDISVHEPFAHTLFPWMALYAQLALI